MRDVLTCLLTSRAPYGLLGPRWYIRPSPEVRPPHQHLASANKAPLYEPSMARAPTALFASGEDSERATVGSDAFIVSAFA